MEPEQPEHQQQQALTPAQAHTQQQRQELKVESSDSPSKPEDYVTVGDYRLVRH